MATLRAAFNHGDATRRVQSWRRYAPDSIMRRHAPHSTRNSQGKIG